MSGEQQRYIVENESLRVEMELVGGFAGAGMTLPFHAELVTVKDTSSGERAWEKEVADRHMRPIFL